MEALDNLPTTGPAKGPATGAAATNGMAAPAREGFRHTLRQLRGEGGTAAGAPVGAGPRSSAGDGTAAAGASTGQAPAQVVPGQVLGGLAAAVQVEAVQTAVLGGAQGNVGAAQMPLTVDGAILPAQASGQDGRAALAAGAAPPLPEAAPQNAGEAATGGLAKAVAGRTPPLLPAGGQPGGRASSSGKAPPLLHGASPPDAAAAEVAEDGGTGTDAEAAMTAGAPERPALSLPAIAGTEGTPGLPGPFAAREVACPSPEPTAVMSLPAAPGPIATTVLPPAPEGAAAQAVRGVENGRTATEPAHSGPVPTGSALPEAPLKEGCAAGEKAARKATVPLRKPEPQGPLAEGRSIGKAGIADRPAAAGSGFEARVEEAGGSVAAGPSRAGGEAVAVPQVATAPALLPTTAMPGHSPTAVQPAAPPPEGGMAPRLAPRVAPAEQVAPVAIALALGGGTDGRISLSLDPVELGRVEVTVERVGDAARVQVAAERPETLALLARDGASLDRALGGAGIGDGGRSISFSLLGGDAGGQGAAGNGQGGTGWSEGGRGQGDGRQGGAWRGTGEEPPAPSNTQHRALLGLLDIAI